MIAIILRDKLKKFKTKMHQQASSISLVVCLLVLCFLSGEARDTRSGKIDLEVFNSSVLSVDSLPAYPRMYVNHEWIIMLPEVYIWGGDPALAEQKQAEWNRLRNAVYVTYPYARQAGVVMRDVQQHLKGIASKSERKKYIKSRERELKDAFGDKISELSVYQG